MKRTLHAKRKDVASMHGEAGSTTSKIVSTNGCKRNSQQANSESTENNESTNCLTVNSFLTWATNLVLERRKQFSSAESFAKSSKWPSPTVSQTTKITTQTSESASLAISSKTCSVSPQDNLLVTSSTNSSVTTTASVNSKSPPVCDRTF